MTWLASSVIALALLPVAGSVSAQDTRWINEGVTAYDDCTLATKRDSFNIEPRQIFLGCATSEQTQSGWGGQTFYPHLSLDETFNVSLSFVRPKPAKKWPSSVPLLFSHWEKGRIWKGEVTGARWGGRVDFTLDNSEEFIKEAKQADHVKVVVGERVLVFSLQGFNAALAALREAEERLAR